MGEGGGEGRGGGDVINKQKFFAAKKLSVCRGIKGVSNHWNGIWNGMVEWKMEWNGECS